MSPYWIFFELRMLEVVLIAGTRRLADLHFRSSPSTDQYTGFYRPYALPLAQFCSTEAKIVLCVCVCVCVCIYHIIYLQT